MNGLADHKNLPSFSCAVAKLQVEKAICADPGLAQLDREMNDAFLRAVASAENDSHRTTLNLTQAQRRFIAERNAQFGRPGYDLRQAMAERADRLGATSKP